MQIPPVRSGFTAGRNGFRISAAAADEQGQRDHVGDLAEQEGERRRSAPEPTLPAVPAQVEDERQVDADGDQRRGRSRRGGAARARAGAAAPPRRRLAPSSPARAAGAPGRGAASAAALLPHEHALPIRRAGRQPCASGSRTAGRPKLALKRRRFAAKRG